MSKEVRFFILGFIGLIVADNILTFLFILLDPILPYLFLGGVVYGFVALAKWSLRK